MFYLCELGYISERLGVDPCLDQQQELTARWMN